MPRKVPKPAHEGADVEEMLSTKAPEFLSDAIVTPEEPTMVLVRCMAPWLKKSNHRRCYRADTFMESEEWVKAHEADLERL